MGALLAVCFVMILLGLVLDVQPVLAHADHPSPDGTTYAYCNVRTVTKPWQPNVQTDDPMAVSCQYAPSMGTVRTVRLSFASSNTWGVDGTDTTYTQQKTVGINTGGKFQGRNVYNISWTAIQPTPSCSIKFTGSDTYRGCIVETHDAGSGGYPTYPTHWFVGGSNGNAALDVDALDATCRRSLEIVGTDPTSQFTTTTVADTASQAVDTYAWSFGDTTTSTKKNPVHIYPALSTMPENGWVAELTITRTPQAGHAFADGTETPKTDTCRLRVDFYNPGETVPVGETGEDDEGDCPEGILGWLNLFKALKCLFVPQESIAERWGGLADALEGNWPTGPVISTGQSLKAAMDGFQQGTTFDTNSGSCTPGPNGAHAEGLDAPITIGSGPDEVEVDVPIIPDGCSEHLAGVAGTVRTGTTVLLWVGFGFAMWRIGAFATGQGGSIEQGGDGS